MEFHLFVNRERENLFQARQILARQRGAVMACIPDHTEHVRLSNVIGGLAPFEIQLTVTDFRRYLTGRVYF